MRVFCLCPILDCVVCDVLLNRCCKRILWQLAETRYSNRDMFDWLVGNHAEFLVRELHGIHSGAHVLRGWKGTNIICSIRKQIGFN